MREYLYSALFLVLVGWGGLALMIFAFDMPPLVWARWGFFVLWFIALTGMALPVVYFLNLRFPSDPQAEPQSIVRQAIWVGVYGSVIAWLQLGHVMAFWIWMGLAGGLVGVEYLVRLRERARWNPPTDFGEGSIPRDATSSDEGQYWLEGDEPTK